MTAEHAEDGFRPTCGRVDELHFRSTPDVWGYFAVKPPGYIHEFSDSQFGHIFARGATRTAATRAMVVALKELNVRGEVRTNVEFMASLLQEEDFVGDAIHTGWLDARAAAARRGGRPPWHLCVLSGALHAAWQQLSTKTAEARAARPVCAAAACFALCARRLRRWRSRPVLHHAARARAQRRCQDE